MAGRNDGSSSITNVAALADVSIATVSRVLSGKRAKDDDIARRVRAAAKQLGYAVNYAASSLRSDTTKTIGLVIPSATEPFSAQLLDEIEPIIDNDSRQLLLGIGGTRQQQENRIESLAGRNVDGLIVVPAAGADLAECLDRHAEALPIVQIGGRQTSFRTSLVGINEDAAMEMVIRHLAEQRIASAAYMAGNELSFESAELFSMFHTHLRTYGLRTEQDWNQFGERSVQRGYACAMRLFHGPLVQPEAVVCADDAIAFGAMMALHALEIRVPEDVLVVGFNDSPIAATALPKLTSVRPPFRQIVSESLRLLGCGTADDNIQEHGDAIAEADVMRSATAETGRKPAARPMRQHVAARIMLTPQLIVRDSSVVRR
ncbi:LacI family DNA-binding transcriptional regulator [Bifidobacterium sp. UBA6881]|uniref:LacI family DNA-binding transcriptional regulator n=1 Tax=Bifidobacterium sp. UBA6881 TaxID=1946109 RepID=UPI000EDECBAA|nr:LacI family DNA-binding transcriptional regulator [Bifidobacterium sp. UBA6881]HAH53127.1 LacI family transcriptional regulator [Bifidobacterium sp.]HCA74040.1 LacI family transcriptional regulator [Bifidobacterium sp.]